MIFVENEEFAEEERMRVSALLQGLRIKVCTGPGADGTAKIADGSIRTTGRSEDGMAQASIWT